jgi:hypothetical protein
MFYKVARAEISVNYGVEQIRVENDTMTGRLSDVFFERTTQYLHLHARLYALQPWWKNTIRTPGKGTFGLENANVASNLIFFRAQIPAR